MSKAKRRFTALLMVFAFALAVFAAGGCGGGGPRSSSSSSSSDSSSSSSSSSGSDEAADSSESTDSSSSDEAADSSTDASTDEDEDEESSESTETTSELTMDDVDTIQAYTDGTVYGTGLVQIDITYKDGVDVSGVTADDYVLTDRGSLSPDYGEIPIESVEIDGQVVTLNISDHHSYATENNTLIYTDDGEGTEYGSRERNAFGIYCTGAWYRDVNGTIYYDEGDEDAGYEANETSMGYQARHSLELKLRHSNEDEDDAACLADEDTGEFVEGGPWLETIDRQFADNLDDAISEGKFVSFADAGIEVASTGANGTDGSEDAYVKGYIYIPENYDGANGIVFTMQGQGISYWQLTDGTNNDGCGIMYDCATTSWAGKGAIVVNIHDRSSAAQDLGNYSDEYDFIADDVAVMKYLIDEYNITGPKVIQGNSRGTLASSMIIKALAGQPYNPANQKSNVTEEETYQLDKDVYDFNIDVYICNNGQFGYQYDDEDWQAVAATGLKVWAFDGEQDSFNNYDNIADYKELVVEYGDKDETWAEENVRLTGYTSNIFYPWGESDHSVTRMNGWYFSDAAYYGPDLEIDDDGEISYNTKLSDGDTYELECRGRGNTNLLGNVYTVYDEVFQEWALKTDDEE